jgi:hypothetical protein
MRYRKYNMEIFYREKLLLSVFNPKFFINALAFWTIRGRRSYSAEALPVSATVQNIMNRTTLTASQSRATHFWGVRHKAIAFNTLSWFLVKPLVFNKPGKNLRMIKPRFASSNIGI